MSIDQVSVDRLGGSCGAIVRGIDITRPQSADEAEAIRRLLDEHLVIALPDQRMDLDRLEVFTDELGGRDVTPYVTPMEGRPFVIRVIKEPSDRTSVATRCGRTSISPTRRCRRVKDQIADPRGTHSGMAYGSGGYLEAVADKSSMKVEPSPDAYAVETHPLVIRHPCTGRPALYANSVYTTGIEEIDPDEARSLLARLTAHATHPNFTCRLRWESDMLAIWDNASTQHFAIYDYPGERRELFRTSVAGKQRQPAV